MPEQRVVQDFSRVKSAELKPREKRECIKMEPHLGGVRVQTYPTSKEGVHQQRVVPDSSRVKSARAESMGKESGARLWWGQERRPEPRAMRECIKMEPQLGRVRVQTYPTSNEEVHQQRGVPNFCWVKVQS